MQELLIPIKKCQPVDGQFRLPDVCVLAGIHAADALPLDQLRADLAKLRLGARIKPDAAGATVTLRRDHTITHPDAYRLFVLPAGVEIVAGTDAGAYYGVQTLRDMITVNGRTLPCCRMDDEPDFRRRGIYHDCSRGKVPKVSTVKQLIECLAHWKINELQLYVENVFTFASHPTIGKGFSPFTAEELLDIQAHAKMHHVSFVPSLTSFGHFEKILMLPEYAHLGELPGHRGLAGGTTLCPGDPGSIRLLADMYDDFLPLFDAVDFNACGDEPWELGQGRSKARAKRVGVGRVYLDFILKIRKLCVKHGKRMNMWGDIVLLHPEIIPDIPRDIVLLNWDYSAAGRRIPQSHKFTETGLPLVCCPGTNGWHSHGTRLPTALANCATFAGTALDVGAEGFLNTDWGDCGHRNTLGVSLCSFAHGAAHSWHTKGVDNAAHVMRFAKLVFGDDGTMAEALSVLGDDKSAAWASPALMESLTGPRSLSTGFASSPCRMSACGLSDAELTTHAEKLAALEWPAPTPELGGFFAAALDDYVVAAEMECLAYRHTAMARVIRAGGNLPAPELAQHADEYDACARDFERIWRTRNEPSRLRDNLNGFRNAAREARELAGKA